MDDDRHGVCLPGCLQERKCSRECHSRKDQEDLRVRTIRNQGFELHFKHKPLIKPRNLQSFTLKAEDATQGNQHHLKRKTKDPANHSNVHQQTQRLHNLVGLLRFIQALRATMLRPQRRRVPIPDFAHIELHHPGLQEIVQLLLQLTPQDLVSDPFEPPDSHLRGEVAETEEPALQIAHEMEEQVLLRDPETHLLIPAIPQHQRPGQPHIDQVHHGKPH